MYLMFTTEEVFHLSRDWLKLLAPSNMLSIVVTFEVSEEPTASQMGEKDMSVSEQKLGGTLYKIGSPKNFYCSCLLSPR